jgi:hypothetical protein
VFFLNIRFALLTVVLSGCSPDPNESIYGETKEYGLIEILVPGNAYDVPNSLSGHAFEKVKMTIVEETRKVPLELGVTFGHRWCGYGMPQGKIHLKYWIIHPDDGDGGFGYIRDWIGENDSPDKFCTTDGYTLGSEKELIPGEWTLKISYQGEQVAGTSLVSNTFYVGQTDEP